MSTPASVSGVIVRRLLAYGIDAVVIAMVVAAILAVLFVLGLVSHGLAWGLLAIPGLLVPLAYHSGLVASPKAATLGMRAMGIRVRQLESSRRPTLPQAIVLTLAFYGSIAATGSLILIVALFNRRRRTLHDWLAGTQVVRVDARA